MKIIAPFVAGVGIYVAYSRDISSTAVANNTGISLSCLTCSFEFRCHSNTSSSAEMIFPNGAVRNSYSYRELYVQQQPNSGMRLYYRYSRYTSGNPDSGVYTCRFTDNYYGVVKEASVGVNFDYTLSTLTLFLLNTTQQCLWFIQCAYNLSCRSWATLCIFWILPRPFRFS